MDALQYLLSPNFQALGTSGRPMVGGWIEVFLHNDYSESGRVITKKDFEGTDNDFKVVLNSLGMANILVERGKAYDVFCYDKDGTLRWSRLNLEKTQISAEYPLVIDTENDLIYIAENGIGRELLKNWHDFVPDSRYLEFKDFGKNIVVTLCAKLRKWLEDEGYSYE